MACTERFVLAGHSARALPPSPRARLRKMQGKRAGDGLGLGGGFEGHEITGRGTAPRLQPGGGHSPLTSPALDPRSSGTAAPRATTTPPPQFGQAAGAAARWVWSTRAGGRRHACRPYSAPGRRPGRPPRPWGRSLAKGAACRNPARRAASSCFLRRSLRRFHRSRSRSTPVNSSRSRSIFGSGRIRKLPR